MSKEKWEIVVLFVPNRHWYAEPHDPHEPGEGEVGQVKSVPGGVLKEVKPEKFKQFNFNQNGKVLLVVLPSRPVVYEYHERDGDSPECVKGLEALLVPTFFLPLFLTLFLNLRAKKHARFRLKVSSS